MSYTKKITICIFLLGIIAVQAGCSKEYKLWLYNYSGTGISIVYAGNKQVVNDRDAVLIYDTKRAENVLLPTKLAIDSNEGLLCYYLDRIKVGGYGQFDKSGVLQVRIKLDADRKIYVYNVAGDTFQPDMPSGIQPEGYPVSPTDC